MNKVMEMDRFEAKDLYLASFLKAKGLSLIDTRRSNGRVFFIFGNKEKAQDLLKQFYNGGSINISLYTKALYDLKTLIHMRQ